MDAAVARRRLDVARSRLAAADADALVIAPSPDLVYLTGYTPMPMERPTVLVLAADERPTLIVPTLERPLAAACPAADAVHIVDWGDDTDPYAVIDARLPAGGRVAVGDRLWASHVLALQALDRERRWISATASVGPLRARKDPEELDALRRAAAGADATLAAVLRTSLEGRTERDVAVALAGGLLAHSHASVGFTIVGSGPNAASPHHEPGDRRIRPGDPVVLDFGGEVDGYWSDTTRTVVVGEPSTELEAVHGIVRTAHAAAIDTIRPGVEIQQVDHAARRVIEDAGFGDRFIHRTGHGIGLEVHEPPYAVVGDATVLEPGMTFSVEPGIYLEGRLGVRIEDIVAVTADGVEVLNGSPRELLRVA